MPTIFQHYEHAKLAAAAYVDLNGTTYADGSALARAADAQKVIPLALAKQLFDPVDSANPWTILAAPQNNDAVGFHAALFGRGTEKVLAIAGTEPSVGGQVELDLLLADVAQIGTYGVAYAQAVSLINYVLRLTAPAGASNVLQLDLSHRQPPSNEWDPGSTGGDPGATGHYFEIETRLNGIGLGGISPGDTITVTGHSLGGHLAAFARRLFPNLISDAYTYNAPGFDPASSVKLADEFVALFAPFLPASPEASFGELDIKTLRSDDLAPGNPAVVSSWLTGTPPSTPEYITTEQNSHGIGQIVDALALQTLFVRMDAAFDDAKARMLFHAASPDTANSEERLLEALHRVLVGPIDKLPEVKAGADAVYSSDGNFSARTTWYDRFMAVQAAIVARPALQVAYLTDKTPADLQSAAGNPDALATRYALAELHPFVILGDYSLYDKFNTGAQAHALDLYSTDTGKGLSPKWIEDRAKLLAAANTARCNDSISGKTLIVNPTASDATLYTDQFLGLTLRDGQNGLEAKHIVFGSEFGDSLRGGNKSDHLYGGAGADILEANAGDDYLEGGAGDDQLLGGLGHDTYRIDKHGGTDTVIDYAGNGLFDFSHGAQAGDGQGSILYNGTPLSGQLTQDATQRSLYRHATRSDLVIRFIGTPGERGNLVIIDPTPGGSKIILRNWKTSELGLSLASTPSSVPLTDLHGTEDGDNANLSGQPHGVTLVASAPNERVWGHGGSDQITLGFAGDIAHGGDGNDIIRNGDGDQTLSGEDGNDILIASSGNDTLEGGTGDDALQGGADDDVLSGGDGMDLLDGGQGSDVITGGAGDDFILGGGNLTVLLTTAAGSNDYDHLADGRLAMLHLDGNGTPILPVLAGISPTDASAYETGYAMIDGDGADVIDAGDGNDWVLAGNGDDLVQGGNGADYLVGQAGNDFIEGGSEDDTLYGDGVEGDLRQAPGSLFVYTAPELQGDDYLDGGDGNDFLSGDGGADELYGGAGDDTLIGDSSRLDAQYHGADYLDGEDGNDTLYGYAKDDSLFGGAGDDILEGDSSSIAHADHGNDHLDGEDGNDILNGDGGSDNLFGGAGNDQLFGDSDDTPLAWQGDDSLDGEDGDDYLRAYGGDDTLIGGAGADQLLAEAGDDHLEGGDGDDTLDAGDGNDTLSGGAGVDAQSGGAGDDTYLFHVGDGAPAADGTLDAIFESGGADTVRFGPGIALDTLQVSTADGGSVLVIDYGSPAGAGQAGDRLAIVDGMHGAVESFEFDDGTRLSYGELVGRRMAGVNISTASDGSTTALGGLGDDVISAGAGRSTFSGGRGNDTLTGSGGNNSYLYSIGDGTDRIIDTGAKTIAGVPAPNTLRFGPGITAADLALGLGSLLIRVGSDPNDAIHIEGFDPADALATEGGAAAGPALDRFEFADGSVLTYAELLARGFDIAGTAGDDIIPGTSVTDRMAGGAGNDTYGVANPGDQVIEAGNAGEDAVEASIDFQLPDNVENLLLTGNARNGAGNALDNRLAGNAQGNTLSGGAGDDFLDGGQGNDTLQGGEGSDTYRLARHSGTDLLIDSDENRIQLDSGISFADLSATPYGDDLLLAIRGDIGDTGVRRVRGYFTDGAGWQVIDASGAQRDTETLLAQTEGYRSDSLEALKSDFFARARFRIEQNLPSAGYALHSDGSWYRRGATLANGLTVSRTDSLVTTTHTGMLGNGVAMWTAWTTSSNSRQVSWTQPGPAYRSDESVSISQENLVLGDPVVYLSGLDIGRSSQSVWAEVRWNGPQPGGEWHTEQSAGQPWMINGQLGLLVTRTTNDVFKTDYSGALTGNLVGGPGNWQPPAAIPLNLDVRSTHYHLDEIRLTDGDHVVHGNPYSAVIGGAGNNTIYNAGFAYGGNGNGRLIGGEMLIAGTGDQWLQDGATMVVGDGHDTVIASAGQEVKVGRDNSGRDLVLGSGHSGTSLMDVIYGAQGIQNWQARYEHGGEYYLHMSDVGYGYFDSEQALMQRFAGWGVTLAEVLDNGWAEQVAPLPFLVEVLGAALQPGAHYASSGVQRVTLSAPDIATLQPFYDSGVLVSPKVSFGAGIVFSDLRFSWGEVASPVGRSPHVALDIDWGADQGIRVLVPHIDDPVGSLVNSFGFADGSRYSFAGLAALAPPAPDFDPQFFQFMAGGEAQTIGRGEYPGVSVNGAAAADFTLIRDGRDLLLSSLVPGMGSLRLTDWYGYLDPDPDWDPEWGDPEPATPPGTLIKFDDNSVWTAADILREANSAPTGALSISGDAIQHQILTADGALADADGMGAVGYQWQAASEGVAWEDIAGANGVSLALGQAQVGKQVRVLASYTDGRGKPESVASTATTPIVDANDAPVAVAPTVSQAVAPGHAFQFEVPVASFADVDAGDILTLTAALASGAALPAWLSFDAATRRFGGTAASGDVGRLDLKVTATDLAGASASQNFMLLVDAELGVTVNGTSGNDYLEGTDLNDMLEGGAGDDTLTGLRGRDIYLIGPDGGHDVVSEWNGVPMSPSYDETDIIYFSAGIGPADVALVAGEREDLLRLSIHNGASSVDLLSYPETLPRVEFADGTVWAAEVLQAALAGSRSGNAYYQTMIGSLDDDVLAATTTAHTEIHGMSGNDTLIAGEGSAWLFGGAGDDTLIGGADWNTYFIDRHSGHDTVIAANGSAASNNLGIGHGVTAEQLRFTRHAGVDGHDLVVAIDGTDTTVTIKGHFDPVAPTLLDRILFFETESALEGPVLDALIGANHAPDGMVTLSGAATQNQTLVAVNTLADADGIGAMAYQWQTSTDGAGWHDIEGATADRFTPTQAQVGRQVRTVASYTDGQGTAESVASAATAPIANVNDAPTIANAIADLMATEDVEFSFALPADSFADIDVGDVLRYAVTQGDGSALPAWLAFDAAARTLSGTPAAGSQGSLNLLAMAADNAGAFAVIPFTLTVQPAPNEVLTGGEGDDRFTGGAGDDYLFGGMGADLLRGGAGDDTFQLSADGTWRAGFVCRNDGSPGHPGSRTMVSITGRVASWDALDGGSGSDGLAGTAGNDIIVLDDGYSPSPDGLQPRFAGIETIRAGAGDDIVDLTSSRWAYGDVTVEGEAGNDVLWTSSGNDSLLGGAGNDTLDGGFGADNMAGGIGNDIYVVDSSDDVVIENLDEGVDTVQSSVSHALGAHVENLTLTGSAASNATGNALNNVLTGTSGNNTLTGNAGNDTLEGRAGSDVLIGGTGNDGYRFGRGYGSDTIRENDAMSGNTDTARLLAGIGTSQLWFRRLGNDLEASVIGTGDRLTVENWYLGAAYHVEQFRTADNRVLLDSRVELLVQAMAAFAPPPAGQTTLPPSYLDSLAPVIAANWQ